MAIDKQLLKGTVATLVLRLLSEDDMYGYQIIRELEARSVNALSLNEGALYPVLHKLETEKCVEAYWEEAESGRRRKYYHITQKGCTLLASKARDWQEFSQALNGVMSGFIPELTRAFSLMTPIMGKIEVFAQ